MDGCNMFGDLPEIKVDKDGPLQDIDTNEYSNSFANTINIQGMEVPANHFHNSRSMTNMQRFISDSEAPLYYSGSTDQFLATATFKCNQFSWGINGAYMTQHPYPIVRHSSPFGEFGADRSAGDAESFQSDSTASPHPGFESAENYGPFNYFDPSQSPTMGSLVDLYGDLTAEARKLPFNLTESLHCPNGQCVTLRDVQQYSDFETESPQSPKSNSIDTTQFGSGIEEVDVSPMAILPDRKLRRHYAKSVDHLTDSMHEDGEEDGSNDSEYVPVTKRQRVSHPNKAFPSTDSRRSLRSKNKGTISSPSSHPIGATSPNRAKPSPSRRKSSQGIQNTKPFPCTFSRYGCTSSFSSKNEWKRHVSSQHLRLGYWRCDLDTCNPSLETAVSEYNDFNRKDLFTQHLRRMHGPRASKSKAPEEIRRREEFEETLEAIRQRCWHKEREPPEHSVCGVCDRVFEGKPSWEERMEHVGRHYEQGDGLEKEDEELRDWLEQQGLLERTKRGWLLVDWKGAKTKRAPVVEDSEDEDAEGQYE
ncbi:MAG: hypothetical protein M1834_004931 [Cirrosporium novae-zelandiae]|nr:MAG: hypothetical protein M1834_004931 [Cirrosporium novae-zelandiae]